MIQNGSLANILVKFCFLVNLLFGGIFHSAQIDDHITLSIAVKLLDLTCDDSLYYETRNSPQTLHVRINCVNGSRNEYPHVISLNMNKNSKWDIGYFDDGISYGNKFWISITGDLISFQTMHS